ncbi:unnamed protein product [Notodromas monacha]|uniref:Protein ROP n=1 Tax=Notodromas monacha TaxID=399045 RepID=A0A7R9BSU1_9CRUS|nr:unnamed protein product [Notodromas monacha]CAG0919469.1 unnamed protein product [Notodromas monacha]
MALKETCYNKLMNEVIKSKSTGKSRDWRCLVVDKLGMRMFSSCLKMHEIAEEGITLVEDIDKQREPMPSMEAIYLLSPTEATVEKLIRDFGSGSKIMYKAAHVYFSEACPEELFNRICHAPIARYMKTLKEINIAFLPYESQVFSLDNAKAFSIYFNPAQAMTRSAALESIAEQIATLCATLGEYPNVRYRSDFDRNVDVAQLVQQKLDAYKADEPTMGEGPEKARSQLLILDRGVDCVSPLLHELTYQAMVHDLLHIENDVYRYEASAGQDKEVILDERDELWISLRHEHIAVVSQKVSQYMKNFMDSRRMDPSKSDMNMRDLSKMIKEMPQYQKELGKYSTHLHLAESCMNTYKKFVSKLCKVEQDLAMGTDAEGERVRDHMKNIVPVLLDKTLSHADKIRIILLYILTKNGISEENLLKLMQHGEIPASERSTITNLGLLGVNVVVDGNRKKVYQPSRKERITEQTYQMSRWTPLLKDIMEDAIEDKLDKNHFPYLAGGRASGSSYRSAPTSARYGQWHNDKSQAKVKNVPRLIVFVIGGISMSEMRTAYEVTKQALNWEVLIGGTSVLTPETFLRNLKELDAQV